MGSVRSVAEALSGTQVVMNAPLMSIGLDSLAGVELVSSLVEHCGVNLSPTVLFDHPSLSHIASFLVMETQASER